MKACPSMIQQPSPPAVQFEWRCSLALMKNRRFVQKFVFETEHRRSLNMFN